MTSKGSVSRDPRGRRRRVAGDARSPLLRVTAALITLFLMQSGCATTARRSPVPPEQRAAYDTAMGNLPGNQDAATLALEAFLVRYPRSSLADDASEQLARLAFAEGRQAQGMRLLTTILSRYADSDRAAPARLHLAQLEYAQDRADAARQLLGRLELADLGLAEQRAALRLQIALAQTPAEEIHPLSLLAAKLREAADLAGGDSGSDRRLKARRQAVARDLTRSIEASAVTELESMLKAGRDGSPTSAILLELSRRALDAGELDLASRQLDLAAESIQDNESPGPLRLVSARLARLLAAAEANAELPRLRDLTERPRTEGANGTIGVVLPLSGRFASFGQESLKGILLAADLFAEEDEEPLAFVAGPVNEFGTDRTEGRLSDGPGLRVVVRDSEGDPVKAAAAVRELAADDSMMAIVGPIFSAESLGAAEAAEEVDIPLLTLSTKASVAAGGPQAFRIRTAPADEVGVLVTHAFEVFEATRFAVLYPETRYGRGMRKLYWDAVTARGGKMVAAASYDPEATDFSGAIREMIGYRFLTEMEDKALAERSRLLRAARRLEPSDAAHLREALYSMLGPAREPLPPIVDFEVLFIPDASEKITLIAPGLAAHAITGVHLLGSSDWHDPALLQIARRHVSGAVISTPFYAKSDVPVVMEFVEGYEKTFGEVPSAYAAQAFDATNLILVQLVSGKIDREGVQQGLLGVRAYPGATGVLTMGPDGNARRRPFLLSVSGRRFRSLD
jgi:ABC-type branched-subunit amino acid transport system substrate-binding protein/predicted negative regulator of RcsB-dependent stress response